MDDSLNLLFAAVAALGIELGVIKAMMKADDSKLLEEHFDRLVRSRKRIPWDSWWEDHGFHLGLGKAAMVAVVLIAGIVVAVPEPASAAVCQVTITAPANLNERLAQAGTNKVVCLRGTFRVSSPVKPKTGQHLLGPAAIVNSGGAVNGVSPKEGNARNVTIENLDISGFNERGILCYFGTVAINVTLHHNDQNGFGCHMNHEVYGTKLLNSHLYSNGSLKWEGHVAASLKFTETGRPGTAPGAAVVISGNLIENGYGNGVWFDDQSSGALIQNNVIRNHTRHEIRLEVCAGPFLIQGNTISDGRTGPFYGIDVTSTAVARVVNNRVTTGSTEIWVRIEERARTTYPQTSGTGYKIKDILLDGNTAQLVRGCDLANVTCR